jgi:hypothetical protein
MKSKISNRNLLELSAENGLLQVKISWQIWHFSIGMHDSEMSLQSETTFVFPVTDLASDFWCSVSLFVQISGS